MGRKKLEKDLNSERVSLSYYKEMKAELKQMAKEQHRSLQNLVAKILLDYVDKLEGKNG
jgi:predicted HicB family RNase H-like nuclease